MFNDFLAVAIVFFDHVDRAREQRLFLSRGDGKYIHTQLSKEYPKRFSTAVSVGARKHVTDDCDGVNTLMTPVSSNIVIEKPWQQEILDEVRTRTETRYGSEYVNQKEV